MDIWLEMIRENNLFTDAHPATSDDIAEAEKRLGVVFATDYRAFLSEVGACICFGHEIKGLADNINLDVIKSTEEIRKQMDMVPHSWYVIEDTHINGIMILQDGSGYVYRMSFEEPPKKIAYNLESYMTVSAEALGSRSADKDMEESEYEGKAKAVLNERYEEARKTLENPDKVEKILQQMEKKLEKIPGVGDWLADVPAVISLIRSFVRKEYKDVPVGSIIAGLAAILYVVSPIDAIPDIMPGVGMLDDAVVFVACWKMIHDDVDQYQEWREKRGMK